MTIPSSLSVDLGEGSSGPPPLPPPPVNELQHDLDALRIQIAAVMAQQVQLTEQEGELNQRRIAFERQESQLAGHLEARNQKLQELHGHIRVDRQRFLDEKKAWKIQVKDQQNELSQERKAARQAEHNADAERRRLQALRRRLRKRWKLNFAAEQTRLSALAKELLQKQRVWESENVELGHKQRGLAQERLAFNTATELSHYELEEAWAALELRRKQEQQNVDDLRAELKKKQMSLDERTTALNRDALLLHDQKSYWEQRRINLEKECEGLENRVRNLRVRLADVKPHEKKPEPVTLRTSDVSYLPRSTKDFHRSDALDREQTLSRIAAELTDQRLVLFEHVTRLLDAWQNWLTDHDSVEKDLMAGTQLLFQREQSLRVASQTIDNLSGQIQRRESSLAQAEERLAAERAKVRIESIQLQQKLDCLLAVEKIREEQIARYRDHLVELRRRLQVLRREELKRHQEELARWETLRSQYAHVLEENRQRCSTLECEARRLAEKALAVEEYRLETLTQAPDAVKAEHRIQRLRRRWARLYEASEKRILRERQVLVHEAARLDHLGKELSRRAEELAQREADNLASQENSQEEKIRAVQSAAQQEADVLSLRAHLKLSDHQVGQLRDEIERLIHVLIPADQAPALPFLNAA